MKDPANPVCRTISHLLQRIGDKWTVLVATTLAGGSKRFNELRREIPSVSQRMLTLTLRNLERDGLVSRTVTPTIPPRVDYELTDLGHSLVPALNQLQQWALEHVADIHGAQARFDAEADRAAAALRDQTRMIAAAVSCHQGVSHARWTNSVGTRATAPKMR